MLSCSHAEDGAQRGWLRWDDELASAGRAFLNCVALSILTGKPPGEGPTEEGFRCKA